MHIEVILERMMVALEAIAQNAGVPAQGTPQPAAKEEAPVEKPKRTRKKKAEVKEETPAEPEVTIAEVRTALTRLQNAVDGQAARAVLANVGGDGALSKVKPAKYQAVIDAANAEAEKAESK